MGMLAGTSFLYLTLLLLSTVAVEFCICRDSISRTEFIRDLESIISNGGTFKLGFFSPPNSSERYVGIWYNDVPSSPVIWVANQNRSINDSSGILKLSDDGNLVVQNGQNETLWSSDVSTAGVNSTSAQILDSGNLVLRGAQLNTLWQSFEIPSDSFLSNMRISHSQGKTELTSWKSPSDPSIGKFSMGIDTAMRIPEIFIWKEGSPYYRSGPWNGQAFIGVPRMNSVYLRWVRVSNDDRGTVYLTYSFANESFLDYFQLNYEGNVVELYWDDGEERWEIRWLARESECDYYGKCGAFGTCDSKMSPICSCLRGYKPKKLEEWNSGNWTSGCVRSAVQQCERMNTSLNGKSGESDGFHKLSNMKVPDSAVWLSDEESKCPIRCLSNCSCKAYAYDSGIGCLVWYRDLVDTSGSFYENTVSKVKIIVALIVGVIGLAFSGYFMWRWISKSRESRKTRIQRSPLRGLPRDDPKQVKLEDLPLYNFNEIANATNNFSLNNMLGRGGFGPVHRGRFPDGQEIAVKRLSKFSGQGMQEFMNEVLVISRLQHRNLVRLLGCCIEGDERILIYEYMPNKSLEALIFDPMNRGHFNWEKRRNIIAGIARGLLYLHRDSRLIIIHRDLKASNVLLDEDLNPKISDFGMARIFGVNEDQANTRRVVGTYGYMSPEYAMEGQFSEKSDVFSFGVLLLEILSGRRNTSFYLDEQFLNLLGYAWRLWTDDRDGMVNFINPLIVDADTQPVILKFMHMGLLCVQESTKDRPNMSAVVSMLESEIVDLPAPNQPAFLNSLMASNMESPQQSQKASSVNSVTISIIQAR
ncbi:G-type lectin S-receptor-like serine/threonine-protein kinase At1g11330 [Punica granatum]|uniref:Receptor-like serine/threonine-protein kinase n=2 Tax=Punica granatum TaxID=22663 RepID=A0A6P8DRC7_PUNGR|nr:G-type lectin S-receptor-like serine/threonine-protein kinase At1g11330 [Punica granatum]